ncbi:MAG: hypothetical protein AAF909_07880 [Pseudomonadota bacterium]
MMVKLRVDQAAAAAQRKRSGNGREVRVAERSSRRSGRARPQAAVHVVQEVVMADRSRRLRGLDRRSTSLTTLAFAWATGEAFSQPRRIALQDAGAVAGA